MKKRIFSIILAVNIFCLSVFLPYKEVQAFDIPTALWGTMEASRAFFTALSAGGALKRGISIEDFILTDDVDWQNLYVKTFEAYTLFCIAKEKIKVAFENPDLSEAEINAEAGRRGTKIVSDFINNAINVENTTGKITVRDFQYWQEFCHEFSSIAKNGLGNAGDVIGPDTVINANITNNTSFNIPDQLTNLGVNAFSYNGLFYISKGKINNNDFDYSENVPTDRVRIPYFALFEAYGITHVGVWFVDVNRLSGDIIVNRFINFITIIGSNLTQEIVNNVVSSTNGPLYITHDDLSVNNSAFDNWRENYEVNLSIRGDNGIISEEWKASIVEALLDSEAGESIKKGNSQQKTTEVVRENSVPVKRSSLKEEEKDGEKVVSGVVGWDIPNTAVVEGAIAYPEDDEDYIKGIGVIDVPTEAIDDTSSESISVPADTPVVIPDEREDVIAPDVPLPYPIIEIFNKQYGEFYPVGIDITEYFPFCIPFDIAYCINKFNATGTAPVIHIPIVYPEILKGSLGESYDVVIDFNEYVTLRNIIRYFILLLFIVGLMTITRNLIRG